MSNRTLWGIDSGAETMDVDHVRLVAGVHLHVIHSPITTVTMRIGEQQRSYIVLEGCAGCVLDHCRVGCPAALFRRLFQSCVTGATLNAVASPQGLACRPYTRGVFAWPNAHSQPVDSTLLHLWADARLLIHWRRYGAHMCVSALLLATEDGPEPASAMRERTWRTLALPTGMVTRWRQAATPLTLPFGAPWWQSLFLLLPAKPDPEQPIQTDPSITTESVGVPSARRA